jgi:restriction system protein
MPGAKKNCIPRFVQYFDPILGALEYFLGSARPQDVKDAVAYDMNLPPEVSTKRLRSGLLQYSKDIDQARYYLAAAGYIDSSERGRWTLTDIGFDGLTDEEAIELYRRVYRQFAEARKTKRFGLHNEDEDRRGDGPTAEAAPSNPLLAAVHEMDPAVFENLCLRLLRKMGLESVLVTGITRDKGIDGIGVLQVMRFLRFRMLFQCKRYAGSICASQVRDFRGAIQGRADRGIILTTGTFTPEARAEATRDGVPPVELVDGEELAEMIDHSQIGLEPKIDGVTGEYTDDY